MSKNINFVTLKAAHDFARKETGVKSVKLGELQFLCTGVKPSRGSGWSYRGNGKTITELFR